jgi:hypothetical protein
MSQFTYLRLPIDPDAGFPQAFRMAFGTATYVVTCTVNVTDEALLATDAPLPLPQPGAFLVLAVERESTEGATTVFRRKVVPGLEYEADELALTFTDIAVHPRNLHAAGAYGSTVTGGVALRWAS